MKRLNIILAFVFGCLAAAIIGKVAVRVGAQADGEGGIVHVCVAQDGVLKIAAPTAVCPNGQRSLLLKRADSDVDLDKPKDKETPPVDKAKLDDLDQRLKKLEGTDCAALGKSRVVAPFEVVDRTGKRIFYVNDGIAELYNGSGKSVAWIAASNGGGNFVAKSAAADLLTTFGASGQSTGMIITENGVQRVDLGRDPKQGTFRLRFFSSGGKDTAGIGQSSAGPGLAFVADIAGNLKARMGISGGKNGIFWVANGSGQSVAELTEGESQGGRLSLFSSRGENMVVAGVAAGGFGVVRAGPEGFKPGGLLLGLPGSYIAGKP